MKNRLQFRHHSEIFETREQAIEYIYTGIRRATEPSMAAEDDSYGFSLLAEPTILRYKNEENEEDPHIILVIGSATNEGVQYADNKFCIIDIDKTESEIQDLWEEFEKVVRSLTLVTQDTDTLKLYAEKTDDGTILSGDVQVAEAHIFDNIRLPNRLMVTEDGLYTYVNLTYDEERETFTFVVNNAQTGELEKTSVKLSNNYLVGGEYSVEDESLHLFMKDSGEIVIDLERLVDEWDVEGEASKTPIVLTKEEVGYGDDAAHNHVEPWQDILRADVRLADMAHNILKKTSDGRYLYVRGMADNIAYFKDGVEITVADALNECAKKKVSSDGSNIIYEKPDGIFASATLKYVPSENTLIFTASNVTGGTNTERIELNSVEILENMYYDATREVLVITYKDSHGETKFVDIPIGEMLMNWEWDIVNDGHNVKLHKERVIGGNDKVSADAAIYDDPDNILVDKNHELFVKGTADNIKYGRESTVEAELDKLIASDADINARLNETSGKVDSVRADLDAEIARSTSEDERIENKLDEEITRSTEKDTEHDREINTLETIIGTGFTTDGHETVTYKFNELSAKTDTISAKTDTISANLSILSAQTETEIARATAEEHRIEKKFDDALGEGFGIRNTVRDEFDREKAEREAVDNFLSGAIDTLSASSEGKLVDVINTDNSINVDKTDPIRPNVSVNISSEVEDNKPNIIKLNADGIYAGVDLIYEFNEETGSNQLIFKTTNGTKVYDLKTNSVVDKIYYDPTREAIIIEYTVNGHRMPDVVIPVGDLINEWRVSDDTNGAIKLSKVRESGATQDVLYAESIISDHDDNILVNDNGALYVSSAPIDSLREDLDAEIERATSKEQRIEDKLDAEIIRSTERDEVLDHAISAETIARMSADTAIKTALDAEIARSTAIDEDHETRITTNATNIANEITRATNAENALSQAIHAEEDRATTAENALQTAINNEVTRATNAESVLQSNIDAEATARENADSVLQSNIDAETTRAMREEEILTTNLEAEITRSTNKDTELENKIVTEKNERLSADTELRNTINSEVIRATNAENTIATNLATEIQRSIDKDAELEAAIAAEAAAREAADDALQDAIDAATHTLESTTTIRVDKTNPDVWKAHVVMSNADKNIIIGDETNGGIYATANLVYDAATNTIKLYGTNDVLLSQQKLGAGSLLDSIHYDPTEKNLIINYHNADGEAQELQFGVAELFNEWEVKNPSEGSALELTKVPNTGETGAVDYLYGRVLLTKAVEIGGGEVEYGDNIIRIVNNGLYVSGSAITEAKEAAECVTHELKQVEIATFGHSVDQECGSGFTYTPKATACVISAATSMFNADEMLDTAVCALSSKTEGTDEEVDCLKKALQVTQQNVMGITVPECGMNADQTIYKYQAHANGCVISAATSMDDADALLDNAICNINSSIDDIDSDIECMSAETKSIERALGVVGNCSEVILYPKTEGCLLNSATTYANADAILEKSVCELLKMMVDTNTPSASMHVVQDGNNQHFEVDVRLSHGNTKAMTDEELTITGITQEEFTDTNVLRLVALDDYIPETQYNGLYVSNVWDCGEYTENGAGTPGNKYQTDETASAQNLFNQRYRNGVRV